MDSSTNELPMASIGWNQGKLNSLLKFDVYALQSGKVRFPPIFQFRSWFWRWVKGICFEDAEKPVSAKTFQTSKFCFFPSKNEVRAQSTDSLGKNKLFMEGREGKGGWIVTKGRDGELCFCYKSSDLSIDITNVENWLGLSIGGLPSSAFSQYNSDIICTEY